MGGVVARLPLFKFGAGPNLPNQLIKSLGQFRVEVLFAKDNRRFGQLAGNSLLNRFSQTVQRTGNPVQNPKLQDSRQDHQQ
jgi:hypothetical protein